MKQSKKEVISQNNIESQQTKEREKSEFKGQFEAFSVKISE